MKKSIIIAATLFFTTTASWAQQRPTIPVDPEVRIGKLDNGLTYYIRHNEEPKNQVNFYIAQKVGSILEEEDQRGLAHFLEHMCFNGTDHFPGNGVIRYCQSIGVQFGPDLNAYTSVDETVYNIDHVPTTIPGTIDSCLLILHDWADGLSLLAEDIDHERGVIHEEWRTRSNANFRLLEQLFPKIYPNSRYGERFPIGLMSVVDNFEYDAIRRYYHKWYRTDLQGIVVVGDINVDEVEQKVKDVFGPIKAVENPAERVYFQIDDNREPIVALATDKEQTFAQTMLFIKHDNVPNEAKNTYEYLVYQYAMQMAASMLNSRLSEIAERPDAPFSQVVAEESQYLIASTKQSLMGGAVGDPARMQDAATMVYREMLRAVRNGFTAGEYERARAEYMSRIEAAYNNREKKLSKDYCTEFVRNFIENEPIMSREQQYTLMSQLLPNIPVEAINQTFAYAISDSTNLVVMSMLPESDDIKYPSESELRDALMAVAREEIAPYEDKSIDEPLISKMPKAGKIRKSEMAQFGYKHLTLSNGVNVYFKSTDYNKDEILLSAYSEGGMSLYPTGDWLNLKLASEVAQLGGLGSFSVTDLRKALAGKQVSVQPYISLYDEGLSASSTVKDLETMFQLVYLTFTAQRKDTAAFSAWRNQSYAIKLNAEKEPMTALQDSLMQFLFARHPMALSFKAADILNVDYDRCLNISKERFQNAKDFCFVITGAIDEDALLPMLERYIASLPAKGKTEHFRDMGMNPVNGNSELIFRREMEVPMATTVYVYSGDETYNMRNLLVYNMIDRILNIVLTEEIREKEGGTYFVMDNAVLGYQPKEQVLFQVFYQTDPARYEYLNGRIEAIINDFATNGPSEENIAKVRETMAKDYQHNLTENSFWQKSMQSYINRGIDGVTDYENLLNSITADELKNTFAALLAQKNRTLVIMNGEKE